MALTVLSKFAGTRVGSLQLDASLTESHGSTAKVTEHPLETGGVVNDHVQQVPDVLTMTGYVSNTPLPAGPSTIRTDLGDVANLPDQPRGQPGRAESAYQELRRMKETGAVLTIVTKLWTYENMVLTSLTVDLDAATGEALPFSATLAAVRFVETRRVLVTETRAKTKKNLGPQTGKEAQPPEKAKSGLVQLKEVGGQIIDGAKNLFSSGAPTP